MATDAYDAGGVPDDSEGHRRPIERTLVAAGRRERWLWALVACSLLADVLLTHHGLRQGLTEGNPLVRSLVAEAGIGTLGVLKGGVVALGLTVRSTLPARERAVVPIALCLPWLGATLVNAALLFG